MAKCGHNLNDILAYLMGELEADHKESVERQINSCAICQGQYQRIKILVNQLSDDAKGLTNISQDDLFLYQLRERIDEQKKIGWIPRLSWATLGTAVSIMLILVLVQINKGGKPGPDSSFVKKQVPVRSNRNARNVHSMPNIQLSNIRKPADWMQGPISISSIYRPDFPSKPDINIKVNLFNKIPNS